MKQIWSISNKWYRQEYDIHAVTLKCNNTQCDIKAVILLLKIFFTSYSLDCLSSWVFFFFNTLMLCLLSFRYDSFTGVPLCQQNLSLEKASILFNMAALYSQFGTRANRQTLTGLEEAVSSFQKAAGMQRRDELMICSHINSLFSACVKANSQTFVS